MKQCSKCHVEKPESEFNSKGKGSARLQTFCKVCNREYQKSHYSSNKAYYYEKKTRYTTEARQFYKELKSTLKCERCPENHPACLDFHHIDSLDKVYTIGRMAHMLSKETLLKEVAKCIVLCSNCHRKEHHIE